MRTIPDLSDGWSFPLTSAEVDDYFPQVGFVSWRTTNSKQPAEWGTTSEVLFNLSWHPGISRPQPIITIRSVPSVHQAEVRNWIDQVVAPELRAWLEALPTRSSAWFEHAHVVSWKWPPAADSAS
jgi:hypothetical protein